MAFSDEAISAIVKEAKFTDQRAEDLLTDYLIKRRDKIGEAYFAKVLSVLPKRESFRRPSEFLRG